jgi:hypothetical protein
MKAERVTGSDGREFTVYRFAGQSYDFVALSYQMHATYREQIKRLTQKVIGQKKALRRLQEKLKMNQADLKEYAEKETPKPTFSIEG